MKKTLLIALLITILSSPAYAFSVEHHFKVGIGAFDASRTTFTYALTDKSYSVNSNVKTNGFFDALYPFKANYSTTGIITKQGLETRSYHYDSKTRFNTRSKDLIYNEQGVPTHRISSKNGKEKKAEIEQTTDNKDTTDLQTVFAELARQYNNVKFCDSRQQVFDGKRRYDVIFKDEGQEKLQADKNSPFSGIASKCSMYIDKLGAEGDDLLWELTSDKPVYFWILKDKVSQKPFIARVNITDTPLGALNVYTTKITVKD